MKFIALLLLLVLSFTIAHPALASLCRNFDDHSICILSIKRSAKHYWEYRVAVSVDGVKRPIEVYNCRDNYEANRIQYRMKVRQDESISTFEPNNLEEFICSFFQR